ncbi:MAG TPA: hypothetical protein VFV31_00560 [Chitinophagaceae bacterium]|nr:hypothetical protein [Chitinophagaceae bacterium]
MQRIIIALLTGLLAGMVTCRLVQPSALPVVPAAPAYTPVAVLEKQRQKEIHAYQQEKEKLDKKTDSLQRAYQGIARQLNGLREENKKLTAQVTHTVSTLRQQPDTLKYRLYCDSLQEEALQLAAGHLVQDSLAQQEVNNLQKQLLTRDRYIDTVAYRIENLDGLLRQSFTQNGMLEATLKMAKKQHRRQRFVSTLKTMGISAVVYWLSRRP